jgi:hypothetical protein
MLDNFDTIIAFCTVMLLFSLLVTAVVQAVITVSNLRGRNLAWGLRRLLQQLHPDLEAHAEDLANAVLNHRSLATRGSLLARAGAIRGEELIAILRDFMKDESESNKKFKEALEKLEKEVVKGENEVIDVIKAADPALAAQVTKAITEGKTATKQIENGVRTWFTTFMDRTTERFVLHTRILTLACALVVAVACDVNTVRIYHDLSVNREARDRLVQGVDEVLSIGDRVNEQVTASSNLATQALNKVASMNDIPEASSIRQDLPDDLVSREQGRDWIEDKIVAGPSRENVEKRFDEEFTTLAVPIVRNLSTSVRDLRSEIDHTGLDLIPSSLPNYFRESGEFDWGHLFGVFLSFILLGLGSPFWFNLLRNLSNLRPILSGRVERDEAQASKSAS